MAGVFEQHDADAAGRIGELQVPRSGHTVHTPALLPVINPHQITIAPARMAEVFGTEILITNAYVLWGSETFGERARTEGLHEVLEFDGAIMTDSGSFQLAEYGDIDVSSAEILRFQRSIGSDIITPVDIPTPPDAKREQVRSDLETTQERISQAARMDHDEALLSAPIQGSTYPTLRRQAAEQVRGLGDIYPIGAVVPLLRGYRFADIVELVIAAKQGLSPAAPVHLFGAGHPMMFALAVAMGCDLFDSAAYARYAREDRYLTVRGTKELGELSTFPCACPVCSATTPTQLREADDRTTRLAEHNLHVSYAELRRIRAAIRDGELLELVDSRARAHPAMVDGYRRLLDHVDWLECQDPVGDGPYFYVSAESANHPAVHRYHHRLDRLSVPDELAIASTPSTLDSSQYDAVWRLLPPFGPVPPSLTQTIPLSGELPERMDQTGYEMAIEGLTILLDTNPEATITVEVGDWPPALQKHLPPSLERPTD